MTVQEMGQTFMDDLTALAGKGQMLHMHPFFMVGDRKGGIMANLELGFHPTHWGPLPTIHLGFIGVPASHRGLGHGARVLQWIMQIADARGWAIHGEVEPVASRGEPKPPMNKKRLSKFYRLLGFEVSKRGEVSYLPGDTGGRR